MTYMRAVYYLTEYKIRMSKHLICRFDITRIYLFPYKRRAYVSLVHPALIYHDKPKAHLFGKALKKRIVAPSHIAEPKVASRNDKVHIKPLIQHQDKILGRCMYEIVVKIKD